MPETILCNATLAADVYAVDAAEARQLVEATASAGFAGVSLWALHHDLAVADGATSDEVLRWHRDLGLTMPVVEALIGWDRADLDVVSASVLPALELGRRAGARYANTVTMEPELDMAEAVVGLAHVCDLAAERDISISVEFLPWSGIPDLATVIRLFDAVDRPNLGLMLDTWHWFRQPGGPDEAALRSLPGDRVHVLQVNDAPSEPSSDPLDEAMTGRLLPGEGDIDLAAVLAILDDIGADPIIAPEVFSSELAALGPAEMARRIAAATASVVGGP